VTMGDKGTIEPSPCHTCAVALEGAALSTRACPKVSFGLQVGAWVCGAIAVVADFFVEE